MPWLMAWRSFYHSHFKFKFFSRLYSSLLPFTYRPLERGAINRFFTRNEGTRLYLIFFSIKILYLDGNKIFYFFLGNWFWTETNLFGKYVKLNKGIIWPCSVKNTPRLIINRLLLLTPVGQHGSVVWCCCGQPSVSLQRPRSG